MKKLFGFFNPSASIEICIYQTKDRFLVYLLDTYTWSKKGERRFKELSDAIAYAKELGGTHEGL